MSALGIIYVPPKQPYDIQPYVVNLRPYVIRGEVISSIAARVYLPGDDPETTYDATMLYAVAYDGLKIQVKVQGGVADTTYRVRVRVQFASGSRCEIELEFQVIETQ